MRPPSRFLLLVNLLLLGALAYLPAATGDDGQGEAFASNSQEHESAASSSQEPFATPPVVKNSRAVAKARAKADCKRKFEEDNGASFDAYGRVIRYGTTPDEIKCEEKRSAKGDDGPKFSCKVAASSRRQYLTKEEKVTSKQLIADKQEELDSSFGSTGAEGAVKRNKFKKEQKARCRVFDDWLKEYAAHEKDGSTKSFFKDYLTKEYEDYAAYRKIAEMGGGGSKKGKKKAKKLKRHIALNIHQDKLPSMCSGDEIRTMMAAIMTHVEDLEKCTESPHTCNPQEL